MTPPVWAIRRAPGSGLYEVRAWWRDGARGWVPSAARAMASSFVSARALLPARSDWATTEAAGAPEEVEWWRPAPPPS